MKREARVLVSLESGSWTVGLVLRDVSIDGVSIARSCPEACLDLARRGYMGELRYATGPCRCGLPEPPQPPRGVGAAEKLAEAIARAVGELEETLREACRS
ncbi:hypothetical protein [Stetteria hydrogenophila]